MTPEQKEAQGQRKLDQRCRACSATSAASARCYRCGSTDVEYATHNAQRLGGATSSWCGNSLRLSERPSTQPGAPEALQDGPGDLLALKVAI